MTSGAFGPFVQLYCKEVLGDAKIRSLKEDQLGRWVIYLCVMQENEGRLPKDAALLARCCRLDKRKVNGDLLWLPLFFSTSECGQFFRSERLERESAKYRKKVDIARNNGKNRTHDIGDGQEPSGALVANPEIGGGDPPRNGGVTLTHKEITPKPPSGSAGGGGRKARKAKETTPISLEIPPAIVEAVNAVLVACPKEQPRGKQIGARIRLDPGLLADRLEALMNRAPAALDLSLLQECWLAYLASAPETVKAPQYFFGSKADQDANGANWHPWARQVFRKRNAASVASAPALAV